nr:hypothetical protein [Tanacetum cinerariifolium]
MLKNPSIPRRNNVNWHYVRDDHMFTMIKLVSRHQNTQQFGVLLPIELTNEDIKNSNIYKEYYAVDTGATPPKPKASVRKTRSSFDTTVTPSTAAAGPRLSTSAKAKQLATISKAKSLSAISEVAMTEMKELPGVPDVTTDESEEEISWKFTDEEGDNDEGNDGDDNDKGNDGEDDDEGNDDDDDEQDVDDARDNDDQEYEGDDDQDDQEEGGDDEQASDEEEFIHPSLSTHAEEETRDKESFDPILKTPENTDDEGNGEENLGKNVGKEEGHNEEEEEGKLCRDVKEQVKVQVSKIFPKIKQTMNEQLEAKDLTQSSNSSKTSYVVAADLSEMDLKKILIQKIEGNKSIQRSNEQRNLYKALVEAYESDKIILDTYRDTVTLKRRRDDDAEKDEEPSARSDRGSKRLVESSQHPEWFSQPKKPPTPDRDWHKTLMATHGSIQPWISDLAKQSDSRSSFNELMDTPVDFSTFLMNQLKVDTLTPKLLAGPTYELMKGSCKSLVELELFLEEVYKATTDQLTGCIKPQVYNFCHQDKGSRLRHIKWIEDLVPRTTWIQEPVGYDKHALWGISYWGRKRQHFYCFAINRKSAHDVYSKRRIIAVTELKIVEWHNYKHLDWITLTNLTVKERFAFNVSLRMFTKSIVIQRRVEDLQLDVESYQKKLNLTRPNTYRYDLKRKEAYIACSNPRGFIYQNKDKQNRLMRIDELHKFSYGTLIDARTALDDRLKGIHIKIMVRKEAPMGFLFEDGKDLRPADLLLFN